MESADRMVKPVQQLALFCVNSKRQGLEIKSTERLSSSPHELPSAVFAESWAILGGERSGGKSTLICKSQQLASGSMFLSAPPEPSSKRKCPLPTSSTTAELSWAQENAVEHSAFSPRPGCLSLPRKLSLSNPFLIGPVFLLEDNCSPAEANFRSTGLTYEARKVAKCQG